jgi:large repetitive protein
MLVLSGCTKYSGNAKSSSTTTTTTTTGSGSSSSGSGSTTGSASSGSSGSSNTSTSIVIIYTSTAACAPSNEVFTFSCNGSAVPVGSICEWYFGDGTNATGNPVTHTYTDGGYRTVLVKVKKDSVDVAQQTISVKVFGQKVTPIASFTYLATTQIGTQATYDFQSTSTIATGAATYKWDFGDGGTGTDSKTTHTFTQKTYDQTFNVKLTTTGDAGCSDSKTVQMIVPAAYNITGDFTYTSTSACLPSVEEFTFSAPTTGVPTGAICSWVFNDASGTSLGNIVKKTFTYASTYNVVLSIIYNGKTIYTSTRLVKTLGQDATPKASFSVQIKSTTATTTTYFCNNSSSVNSGFNNVKWEWDFGDNTTSSTTNPNVDKVYYRDVIDKTYTIKMIVTANSGCSATATSTIIVPKI